MAAARNEANCFYLLGEEATRGSHRSFTGKSNWRMKYSEQPVVPTLKLQQKR
jgi:hypothetical protein